MAEDVIRYVRSCSVCAMSKSPCHLPAGKLVPLPVPQSPSSHIGVDFVTDLPNAEGHTCVLVVVDRFSKACKLIPLKVLPTALETAESLSPCVLELRSARGHSVRPGSPVHFTCMEGLLSAPRVHSQLIFRVPSPDKWPRLSVRSRSSDVTFGHTARTISTAGADSSPGPSMPRTPSDNPPPALPHFNAHSVTSPCSSPGRRSPRRFQLWTTGSESARGYGTQPTSISSVQCGGTNSSQTSVCQTPLDTSQAIGSGFRPGTSASACPARS